MLAHGVAVAFGTVQAAYAMALGIVHVDGLHAGPHAPYAAQRRHAVDEGAVDVHLAAHHQAVAPLGGSHEAVVVVVGLDAHIEAGVAQLGLEHRMGAVGYEYLSH